MFLQQNWIVVVATLCLWTLLITTESYAQDKEMTPRHINITVLSGGGSNQCPSVEERESGLLDIKTKVISALSDYIDSLNTYTCNGTPGWRQVAFINMTNTSYNCPRGLKFTSYSKRTCGRAHITLSDCSSTAFSVGGSEYSQVCGRIRGYQVGATSAFYEYLQYSEPLDGAYVSGVSLTHRDIGARRRTHIWTYAAGLSEASRNPEPELIHFCPCDTSDSSIVSPPFVGNDYFCESGLHSLLPVNTIGIISDDPLWDGQGCSSTSRCCQFNNPPWFTKTLPNATTDDIELRLCLQGENATEDVALELIELYVQ